jgi:subtilisin family serine protease
LPALRPARRRRARRFRPSCGPTWLRGDASLDARIPTLIPGLGESEIPYFAVLAEPNDAVHRAELEALGARVLRAYRSVDAFALASDAATVSEVAALAWVDWLAPVEVVEALNDERNTPADVGAPPIWDGGATGEGVRIAVLDTGLDRVHQDLDDLDFRNWVNPLNPPKVVDARDFNGGTCKPIPRLPVPVSHDGNGHGTHVAGIATGTGEGDPASSGDDGLHAGVAPGAELAVGKALTDAGAGVNSDLIAATSAGLVYLGGAGQVLDTVRLISAPLTTAGFQRLEQAVTIPAGVVAVRVVLAGFAPTDVATAGTVTFDDVGLFEQ